MNWLKENGKSPPICKFYLCGRVWYRRGRIFNDNVPFLYSYNVIIDLYCSGKPLPVDREIDGGLDPTEQHCYKVCPKIYDTHFLSKIESRLLSLNVSRLLDIAEKQCNARMGGIEQEDTHSV